MVNTIRDAIKKQNHDSFKSEYICSKCKFHRGNLKCNQNVFIAFVGADTHDCIYFEERKHVN